MHIRAMIILGACLFVSTAHAETICQKLPTREATQACEDRQYKLADDELNKTYHGVVLTLDAAQQKNLATAEQAWIQFRDKQCAFDEDLYYRNAGGLGIYHKECLTDLTKTRTKTLWKYMNEVNE